MLRTYKHQLDHIEAKHWEPYLVARWVANAGALSLLPLDKEGYFYPRTEAYETGQRQHQAQLGIFFCTSG